MSREKGRLENKIIKLLSRREYCKFEIKKKLINNFDDDIVNEVINEFEKSGIIDDDRYQESFINTVINTTNKGKNYILNKLSFNQIKINYEYLEKTFTNELNYQRISKLIENEFSKNSYSKVMAHKKAIENITRKGYSYSDISIILNDTTYNEIKALKKEVKKLINDKEIIKKLIRKGYENKNIKGVINDINNNSIL